MIPRQQQEVVKLDPSLFSMREYGKQANTDKGFKGAHPSLFLDTADRLTKAVDFDYFFISLSFFLSLYINVWRKFIPLINLASFLFLNHLSIYRWISLSLDADLLTTRHTLEKSLTLEIPIFFESGRNIWNK